MQRKLAPQIWTGDPNNNTSGGGYAEFIGLDIMVNEGNKVHAINGTPCPAMDSFLDNFDYELVNGGGRNIVEHIDAMLYYLERIDEDMGFGGVDWALVMRPEAFDEIAKVVPVRYYQEMIAEMIRVGGSTGAAL